MPPNPPSNSRLPQLAVWSGYGTELDSLFSLILTLDSILQFQLFHCMPGIEHILGGGGEISFLKLAQQTSSNYQNYTLKFPCHFRFNVKSAMSTSIVP